MISKDTVIKSLKKCSTQNKNCENCIYNRWMFDTCQTMIIKDALKVIERLDLKLDDLRDGIIDVSNDIKNLIGG